MQLNKSKIYIEHSFIRYYHSYQYWILKHLKGLSLTLFTYNIFYTVIWNLLNLIILFVYRVESFYDVNQLKELFNKAKIARCRSRFVVPVILYEGKVRITMLYIICIESG